MQTSAYSYPPREKFDTKAAANYLGLAPQTLNNWRFLRRGPAYHRVGRRIYYLRADLDAFFSQGRIVPSDQSLRRKAR
jgi:Helix-turn-helix domain